ncbi:hypothetical protein, partial [Rathayibacter sp. AY1E1]|uniref:hypothetical protein n=1 Tax=Rathayibacter sp. AY1E1 TaxID=2080549 RepID=UPI000D3FEF49
AETVARDGFGVQERKTQTNVADIVRTSDTGFTKSMSSVGGRGRAGLQGEAPLGYVSAACANITNS